MKAGLTYQDISQLVQVFCMNLQDISRLRIAAWVPSGTATSEGLPKPIETCARVLLVTDMNCPLATSKNQPLITKTAGS